MAATRMTWRRARCLRRRRHKIIPVRLSGWGHLLKKAAADVKKSFTQLCAWMEPIPKGNELVLTYVPGKGTEVEVNGKPKGTVEGKPTSDAISTSTSLSV